MLSFLGKLGGTAVRLSLILAYLDWAMAGGDEPQQIELDHIERAIAVIEAYLMPMAKRAYAEADHTPAELSARRLVAVLKEDGLRSFSTREMMRRNLKGLKRKGELDPAIALLVEADTLRKIEPEQSNGRAPREYRVNPAIFTQ